MVPDRPIVRGTAELDLETGLSSAQGFLDLMSRFPAGKDESEITVAFRKRDHVPSQGDGDLDTGDAFDGQGSLQAPYLHQHPGRSDREHHYSRRLGLTGEAIQTHAEGVADDDLLKAHPDPEPEGARTESTDRPGSQFHDRHHARGTDTQFSVQRSFPQSHRLGSSGSDCLHIGEDGGCLPRRRDIDGLFEERTIQGVGLIEHGQDLQFPVDEQPFDRHFGPGTKRSTTTGSGQSPRMARIRAATAPAWAASSTRITPWLADRDAGFITQGYPMSAHASASSAPAGTIRSEGWGS